VLAVLLVIASLRATNAAQVADAASPAPSTTPSLIEQQSADVDPTSPVEAWTFAGVYTGSTYGPGNFRSLQIIPREEVLRLGTSLLRATLPPIRTIQGVDSGFGDAQLFYLFAHDVPHGRLGIGFSTLFPTATDPKLGTGKWSIGPSAAYVKLNRKARFLGGFLVQSFFSFAGPSWRHSVSTVALQPVFVKQLAAGWSLRSADATWTFDLQRGSSIVPISLGVGKLLHVGAQTLNVVLADEATLVHANAPNAPKNTARLIIRIMYPRNYRRTLSR
jgi:hypothetical protein